MATKAAAIPAAVLKKARRRMPCWDASAAPYCFTRASNSRCFAVCGAGMNSSLDTDCVGIDDGKAEVSAGNTCLKSSGASQPIARTFGKQLYVCPPATAYAAIGRTPPCEAITARAPEECFVYP